jgi:ribosomal-protein-alanine N-acetyltransferase
MNPPDRIETERLVLRKPRIDDAPILFAAYMHDPEVTRYLRWRPHKELSEVEDFIKSCICAWEDGTRFPMVITLKDSNEALGMIDFHVTATTVGVGYVIAGSHQGKGYATEALLAVIEWAFQQPSIYRVNASTDVDNVASRRVMEKAGMQREGLMRKYMLHPNISDVPRDCYIYAIVK